MSGLSLNLNNQNNGVEFVPLPGDIDVPVPSRELNLNNKGRFPRENHDGTSNSDPLSKHIENVQRMYNPHPERGYHIAPATNSRECRELRDRAYGGDPDAQYSFAVRLIMKQCGTKLESENDWMDLLDRAASSGHVNARRLYDFFNTNHGNNTYQYFKLLRNNPAKLLENILEMPERGAAEASPAAFKMAPGPWRHLIPKLVRLPSTESPTAAAAASPAAASSLGNVLRNYKTEKNKAKKAALAAFVSSPESASASASSSSRSRPIHELSPHSQAKYRNSVRRDFAAAERAEVKSKSKKGGRTRRRHKKRTTRKR